MESYLIALKHHLGKNNEPALILKKESKCISMSFTAGFDHVEISIETSGELSPQFNCTMLLHLSTELPRIA